MPKNESDSTLNDVSSMISALRNRPIPSVFTRPKEPQIIKPSKPSENTNYGKGCVQQPLSQATPLPEVESASNSQDNNQKVVVPKSESTPLPEVKAMPEVQANQKNEVAVQPAAAPKQVVEENKQSISDKSINDAVEIFLKKLDKNENVVYDGKKLTFYYVPRDTRLDAAIAALLAAGSFVFVAFNKKEIGGSNAASKYWGQQVIAAFLGLYAGVVCISDLYEYIAHKSKKVPFIKFDKEGITYDGDGIAWEKVKNIDIVTVHGGDRGNWKNISFCDEQWKKLFTIEAIDGYFSRLSITVEDFVQFVADYVNILKKGKRKKLAEEAK